MPSRKRGMHLLLLILLLLWGGSSGKVRQQDSSIEERMSSCPVGHFECKEDPDRCIPQADNCNGKWDCPAGSDEENCKDPHLKGEWDWAFVKRPDEDAEKLNDSCSYAFDFDFDGKVLGSRLSSGTGKRLPFILSPEEEKYLPLSASSDNTNLALEDEGLALTRDKCICNGEKLFCQNLRLRDLAGIPPEVEFLDLSGSRVDELDFSVSPFPNLHTLVLSASYIEDIVPQAFGPLKELRVLYLTNNRLRYLAKDFFTLEEGSTLERLYLDYNQISVIQNDAFYGLSKLVELNLRHNQLSGRESGVFAPLVSLKVLHLNHNRIESVRKSFLSGLESLETLSLHGNAISYLESGAFQDLRNLKELYLHWNHIRVLENEIFCNLHNLLTLNLRGNLIQRMDPAAFLCLEKLNSLNMEANRFGEVTSAKRIFEPLKSLQYIYFDHFWMCSWALHVRSCEPKGDGISSISNLLDSVVLRICVWIMGILSIAGNIFVIFCRMIIREPNKVHSFYIRNLAGADLLMGLFLLSIGVHDIIFRGDFLSHQYQWRHSLTCQISGLLSTWSSEASVLILTLITLDRYWSIVQPFSERRTSIQIPVCICLFLWVLSFLISLAPLSGLFPTYFDSFYSTNGLCLPLHIHNPFDPGWEYSFILFVLINSAAFIFMVFAYVKMLQVIRKSTLMIRSNQQKQDSLLAKRFGLVVLTDFLCWAPIVGAKVVGMTGVSIPSDLYAWLAVFALPVNSALNPIIYTITTKLFKQQLGKMTRSFHSRLWRRGAPDETSGSLSMLRYKTQRTGTTSLSRSLRQSTIQGSEQKGQGQGQGQGQSVQMTVFRPNSNSKKMIDDDEFATAVNTNSEVIEVPMGEEMRTGHHH